jgi:PAS domain S-box-containing protein
MLTTRTWGLLIAAALLVAVGALNFAQRATHQLPPTDGVVWVQTGTATVAQAVEPYSAAAHAGILQGDILEAISQDETNFDPIVRAPDVEIYLDQAGIGGHLTYLIKRPSFPTDTQKYLADVYNIGSKPRWRAETLYLNAVGVVFLLVGFFVLFKQGGRAPFVPHFAMLSLAAFVFLFFQPVGEWVKGLDLVAAALKDVAFIFFGPLFLHFCLLYPVRYHLPSRRRWMAALLYLPGLVLMGMAALTYLKPSDLSRLGIGPNADVTGWFIKASFIHFLVAIMAGAAMLIVRFVRSHQPVVRQQLKWVVWGSTLAVLPLTLIYGIRFIFDLPSSRLAAGLAILPLILIPLTFGNSVVRYRLMDVDIVVRRAVVYAFTTLAIAMMVGAVVFFAVFYALDNGDAFSKLTSGTLTLQLLIVVISMAVIVMVAAPIKNFLQERADRFFYGERYDMRQSLLDFGRTLSATTGVDQLLNALVGRLQQVLNVERVAIFVEDERSPGGYRPARIVGLSPHLTVPINFREMIRAGSSETGVVRADDLEKTEDASGVVRHELHYYVPCVTRGRMVAVIGLGRAADGSLLSSEDVGILRTVSGYVAVAIENSLLYQEQHQRAAELELLKEFNESIVESVNVGLLAVDLDGRVKSCNSTLEKMLEINRDEAIGKFVAELFAEEFAETLEQVLGRQQWRITELRNIYKLHTATRDGRGLVLNIALAPLRADSAGRTGAIIVLEDVTSRIRLEEQLQQREKLSSIGLLAAGVAHEVNTPLTGVSSYTQMLLGMLPENDPKHALLQKVKKQSERASDIVNNLLNFSRTGDAAEFAELDVHRVLDDTLQLLEPQFRRSRIEIVRDYAPDLPAIYGNSGKLQQVFTNLLLNARDAIPGGGNITLTTAEDADGSVTIDVADSGIGIAPDNIAKIYDPFFTTKGVGRGTGLGLAITYGIMQEHAGHISVESAPGMGTVFHLSLPTADSTVQLERAAGD